ncbi:MAG: symmetrical bis(5'-nucleosyl)-tetraphosphatase [Acidobacteriota bacterium]
MTRAQRSTWIVGDVHGWREPLETLLQRLAVEHGFDPQRDRLWTTGDLVNKGPHSLDVLRWAVATQATMGERFVVVLGNHDLHLLALALGASKRPRPDLEPVLAANDREALLGWLRRRPVAHREGDALLVHAGLWPSWTLNEALSAARRVEEALRGDAARALLRPPGGEPGAPDEIAELRRALAGFTALRSLTDAEEPCSYSGGLADLPAGCRPWFDRPSRRAPTRVIFGHWAALGVRRMPTADGGEAICLDGGCAWGGALVAWRLEDGAIVRVRSPSSPPA